MTAAGMVIWVHALVALLFCGVTIVQARSPTRLVPRGVLASALVATALWALAVAGIGVGDPATRVAGALRNLAWLLLVWQLARADGAARMRARTHFRTGAYLATAACFMLAGGVGMLQLVALPLPAQQAVVSSTLALRMLSTAAALVLVHRAQIDARDSGSGGRQVLMAALALMWSADLTVSLLAYFSAEWPALLTLARGLVMAVVAPLIAVAVHRDGKWTLRMSRTVALQGVMLVAAMLYVCATVVATGLLSGIGGDHVRVIQTAFVFGTAAAVLTIGATPWLRAWTKVIVAKHLFSHRYDYRAEWMRFTETLGAPGEDAAPLAARVVKAMADLTDSPAGLLLAATGDTLEGGAAWQCEAAPADAGDARLARHLEATRRIVSLDAVRAGAAPLEERLATPDWLVARAEAWALVPLIHLDRLVGAIVLARPPVDRALDWEDFDLLGAAGRQAASYLAEDRAHAALADARRFEEFTRRFAFIMHDLKNLVSQLALVARNAERHADNPAFRADMIETLKDSSQRMTNLLARLSQHSVPAAEATRAVALLPLAERLADARRAQHPIIAHGAVALGLGDPAGLETVLGHLIQNAVEASAPGVPVRLETRAEGGAAMLDVVDAGSGMSAAFLRDELFRPFASSKPGGFGLGAFEARQMVEAMGGRIEVTTREGEGTRFRIILPRADMLEAAA